MKISFVFECNRSNPVSIRKAKSYVKAKRKHIILYKKALAKIHKRLNHLEITIKNINPVQMICNELKKDSSKTNDIY